METQSVMGMSRQGLQVMKAREACRLKAYDDGGGVWTIGWGHTKGVKQGMVCTLAEAEGWLREDLKGAEDAVRLNVRQNLAQSQFDALVSFTFNVGVGAFRESTLLRKLNAGDYQAVPSELRRWIQDNGKVVEGLKKRREEEVSMWEGRLV